jgi:hypothetical protein
LTAGLHTGGEAQILAGRSQRPPPGSGSPAIHHTNDFQEIMMTTILPNAAARIAAAKTLRDTLTNADNAVAIPGVNPNTDKTTRKR